MYCRNCGKEIADNAAFCPNCGVATGNVGYTAPYAPAPTANRWLVTVAKVFIILSFIAVAISLFTALILTISSATFVKSTAETNEDAVIFYMFVIYLIFVALFGLIGVIFGVKAMKCMKNKVKPSVAVCVCVLLFCNLIAGILLLCTKNEDYI